MTIVCSRCGGSKDQLVDAPLPGAIGARVAAHVCGECWAEWIQASIRVINHYGLQPQLKDDREKLFELMEEFLALPAA